MMLALEVGVGGNCRFFSEGEEDDLDGRSV